MTLAPVEICEMALMVESAIATVTLSGELLLAGPSIPILAAISSSLSANVWMIMSPVVWMSAPLFTMTLAMGLDSP